MKPTPEFALRFYNQVHVRVRLVGVERHGIPVLQRELTGRRQYLLGRRGRWHRQHNVVHQLQRSRGWPSLVLPPVLTG